MGNSPPTTTSLRRGNGDQCYNVQLGESAAISFRGKQVKQQANGETTESWQMSYTVDNPACNCNFALTRTKGNTKSPPPHDEKLFIRVSDDAYGVASDCLHVIVQGAEAGLLHRSYPEGDCYIFLFSNITHITDAWGGITETISYTYIREGRMGLIVNEWMKRSEEEEPYMGTMAHYYVNVENGNDVGLSVIVKRIGVSDDGHLDFAVDGPKQHPVDALFYMFDEVRRTGTWKPTYCPHCANNFIQRLRGGFWQSENEDSDIDNVPAAPLRSPKGDEGGIIANDGMFRDNNNGNLNIRNAMLLVLLGIFFHVFCHFYLLHF